MLYLQYSMLVLTPGTRVARPPVNYHTVVHTIAIRVHSMSGPLIWAFYVSFHFVALLRIYFLLEIVKIWASDDEIRAASFPRYDWAQQDDVRKFQLGSSFRSRCRPPSRVAQECLFAMVQLCWSHQSSLNQTQYACQYVRPTYITSSSYRAQNEPVRLHANERNPRVP
ncbi:hypothetical protein F4782DRAFT_508784 [Xylaria castorea]|nr:hypothetical protein F4782DRAFT_508784 [Xylaria castorea]